MEEEGEREPAALPEEEEDETETDPETGRGIGLGKDEFISFGFFSSL